MLTKRDCLAVYISLTLCILSTLPIYLSVRESQRMMDHRALTRHVELVRAAATIRKGTGEPHATPQEQSPSLYAD